MPRSRPDAKAIRMEVLYVHTYYSILYDEENPALIIEKWSFFNMFPIFAYTDTGYRYRNHFENSRDNVVKWGIHARFTT